MENDYPNYICTTLTLIRSFVNSYTVNCFMQLCREGNKGQTAATERKKAHTTLPLHTSYLSVVICKSLKRETKIAKQNSKAK